MTTVSQMKCACDSCLCIVAVGDAIEKEGHYYCSETCSQGHPNGQDCGHHGCGCGS